jgi:hypothetical protein
MSGAAEAGDVAGRRVIRQDALSRPADAPPVRPWLLFGAGLVVAITMFFVYTPR